SDSVHGEVKEIAPDWGFLANVPRLGPRAEIDLEAAAEGPLAFVLQKDRDLELVLLLEEGGDLRLERRTVGAAKRLGQGREPQQAKKQYNQNTQGNAIGVPSHGEPPATKKWGERDILLCKTKLARWRIGGVSVKG